MAGPDEPPFNGNGTVGRLLTCEIPAPVEMLRRRPGICSERYEREKAEFDNLPWYERMLTGHGRAVGLEPTDALQSAKTFQEACEKMPDEISKSALDEKVQQLSDHATGRNPLSPEQSLELKRQVSFLQDVYTPGPRWESGLSSGESAWLSAQNQRWGNSMAIAFLGPVYGGPGAMTRLMGGSENLVEAVNNQSASLVGAGRTRVFARDAAALRESNARIFTSGEYNRGARLEPLSRTVGGKPAGTASPISAPTSGTVVQQPVPSISRQKQNGHVKGSPQNTNRIKQGKPTSTFNGDAAEADRLTQEAWQKGTPVVGRPNVRDYDFGQSIGTGPNGGGQSIVRVHQDAGGNIHGHPAGPEIP